MSTLSSCPEMNAASGRRRKATGQAIGAKDDDDEDDEEEEETILTILTVVPLGPNSFARERTREDKPDASAFDMTEAGARDERRTIRLCKGALAANGWRTWMAREVTSAGVLHQVASTTKDL